MDSTFAKPAQTELTVRNINILKSHKSNSHFNKRVLTKDKLS
ncbi:hypothetical protein C5S39_14295 [Candidatus Methanophagaceae archaeon]|nr:hypothetical protein C5S39_14295 [Methanophagales archaeon]